MCPWIEALGFCPYETAARVCGCSFVRYINDSNRLDNVTTLSVTHLDQVPVITGLIFDDAQYA